MKKLICGFLCVSASAVFAAITNVVATVDVIAVDSGLKNTIVAIPGLDLTGDKLVISNLVKTSGLQIGDKLYAFNDGQYETWELKAGAGESKYWDHAAQRYTITATTGVQNASTPADMMKMDVGSGIWLSRNAPYGTGNPFYIYAAHTNAWSTTVPAGKTVLLGNPRTSNATPTITGMQSGDQVIVHKKFPKSYKYNGSAWTPGLPEVTCGTGFWYKSTGSGSERTVSW